MTTWSDRASTSTTTTSTRAVRSGAGTVNVFDERIGDPRKAGDIAAAAIDRLTVNFAARPGPSASGSWPRPSGPASIGQMGLAVQMITAAVFFALLFFSVGAVMIQSAREHTG